VVIAATAPEPTPLVLERIASASAA